MKLELIDEEKWNELVEKSNYSTIFHTSSWVKKLSTEKLEFLGIIDDGKRILAGTYLHTTKKYGLKICTPPKLTPYQGILYNDEYASNMKNPRRTSFVKETTRHILKAIKSRCSLWMTTFPFEHKDFHEFLWNGFEVTVGHSYVLDLSLSENKLWDNLDSKRIRNPVRKALKDGIRVENSSDTEYLNHLSELVKKTFDRQEIPYDVSSLGKIPLATKNFRIFLSFRENNPIAGALIVWDDRRAYYISGGYDYENKHSGAMVLAMWEAIKYSQKLGLNEFDFEGSMVPNIEAFFRGFGGDLVVLHRSYFFKNSLVKFLYKMSQSDKLKNLRRRFFGF